MAANPARHLVFHRSRFAQSAAVAAATRSKYTHMEVVLLEGNKPVVLEAVQPTKLTPFAAWVARGDRGKVVIKRLNARGVHTQGSGADARDGWWLARPAV